MPKTPPKRRAPRDSQTFVSRYLNEVIDYGGITTTRAEAILHMQSVGCDQAMIDRWFQGYEYAQRRQEQEQKLRLRLYLTTD